MSLAYYRDPKRIRNVHRRHSTGVENGDELELRHIGLLLTSFIGLAVVLLLKGNISDGQTTAEVLIDITYFLFLGGINFHLGVIVGFYTLSLHTNVWSKADRKHFVWCLGASWILTAFFMIAYIVLIEKPTNTYDVIKFIASHITWTVCFFLLALLKIKKNPKSYVKKVLLSTH